MPRTKSGNWGGYSKPPTPDAEQVSFGVISVVDRIPRLAAGIVVLISILVLTGWLFDIASLKTVIRGGTSMKANTALLFLFSGFALWLLRWPKLRIGRYLAAIPVVAIASATLTEYSSGRSLGIDEFLVRDNVTQHYPGRMAPISAAAFIVLTIAQLLHGRKLPFPVVSQGLAVIVVVATAFGVVGYLYGVPLLYGSTLYTAMALHTGVGMLVLAVGILFADPQRGMVRIFLMESSGGVLARVGIPAAVLIPVLLGNVFVREQFNLHEPRLGSALIVMSNSIVFVALIWPLAFFMAARERQWAKARWQANVDGLTGVMNRRHFEERLIYEMEHPDGRARFALVLFDIDYFKALNDRWGHPAGDQVLRAVARALKAGVRTTDTVCRFGGEEFAAIIHAEPAAALAVADELRRAVENLVHDGLSDVRVTTSAGLATYPDDGASRGQLLRAADLALYAAKSRGRNRIVAFSEGSTNEYQVPHGSR